MSNLQDVIKHLGSRHSQSAHAPKSGKTAPKGSGEGSKEAAAKKKYGKQLDSKIRSARTAIAEHDLSSGMILYDSGSGSLNSIDTDTWLNADNMRKGATKVATVFSRRVEYH